MGVKKGHTMNKAIPIEWIDKHLEWLGNCDNDFAQLATVAIRAMVKIWQSEQMLEEDDMTNDAVKGADNEV
jgi:uncharacterized membrane protein YjdF